MKFTYDPRPIMKQWPTQGPRHPNAGDGEPTSESLPVPGVGPVSTGSKAPDYSRWKTELEANIRALGCAVPTNETFYEKLWAKTHGASPAASNVEMTDANRT